jgi:hypothetical protein
MVNKVKSSIFLIVILLTSWSTATHALSNVMLINVKSFVAGGVGGKIKLMHLRQTRSQYFGTTDIHFRLQAS